MLKIVLFIYSVIGVVYIQFNNIHKFEVRFVFKLRLSECSFLLLPYFKEFEHFSMVDLLNDSLLFLGLNI